MMGSQVMRWTFNGRAAPWKSVRVTPAGVRMATSPSWRKWMLRVWWRMPGTSEARKYSPSPIPITAGGPMREVVVRLFLGAPPQKGTQGLGQELPRFGLGIGAADAGELKDRRLAEHAGV